MYYKRILVALIVTLGVALPTIIWLPLWDLSVDREHIDWKDMVSISQYRDSVNKERLLIAQIAGGAVAIMGLLLGIERIRIADRQVRALQDQVTIAQSQLNITHRSALTDRYIKAVEQLGSGTDAVKIGAIFALEQLATEVPDTFYWPVMELVAERIRSCPDFVRTNSNNPQLGIRRNLPEFQKILFAVLSRRNIDYERKTKRRLDLQHLNLSGYEFGHHNLSNIVFTQALFINTWLNKTIFDSANLVGTSFAFADLRNASFVNAESEYADFSEAKNFNASTQLSDYQRGFMITDTYKEKKKDVNPPEPT